MLHLSKNCLIGINKLASIAARLFLIIALIPLYVTGASVDGHVQKPGDQMPATDNVVVRGDNIELPNKNPTIGSLCDPTIIAGDDPLMLKFVVSDEETAPENLIITAFSSNQELLSNENIVIKGTGTIRVLFLDSTASECGKAKVTLMVSDGEKSATETFTVTILKKEDSCF
jgi:hypothetical protein